MLVLFAAMARFSVLLFWLQLAATRAQLSEVSSYSLRLRLRKFPSSVENFFVGDDRDAPCSSSRHDRQAVGNFAVAPAELNRDRTIGVFLRGDVVERIGVLVVLHEVSFGVVESDRPEAVDGHILNVELVDRRAVVLARRDVEINGILIGIESPACRGNDQVSDRIDLTSAAGGASPVNERRA